MRNQLNLIVGSLCKRLKRVAIDKVFVNRQTKKTKEKKRERDPSYCTAQTFEHDGEQGGAYGGAGLVEQLQHGIVGLLEGRAVVADLVAEVTAQLLVVLVAERWHRFLQSTQKVLPLHLKIIENIQKMKRVSNDDPRFSICAADTGPGP